MYSSAYVWAKVLGHMENRLTAAVVSTWFDDVEVVELTDTRLVLYSPSDYRKEIILRRCADYIKDAMRLRDVSPTLAGFLKAPAMTINCIYVPLLTAASKAADELSIASVTRGIENPKPRTCLVKIQMRSADFLAIVLFTAFLAAEIVWKAVGV